MFHHYREHTGGSQFDATPDVGVLRWKFITGPVDSSPTIGADGTICIGSDDDNLYAINPDGTQKWKFTTGDQVSSSPAVGADGTIFAGSGENLYAVGPTVALLPTSVAPQRERWHDQLARKVTLASQQGVPLSISGISVTLTPSPTGSRLACLPSRRPRPSRLSP